MEELSRTWSALKDIANSSRTVGCCPRATVNSALAHFQHSVAHEAVNENMPIHELTKAR